MIVSDGYSAEYYPQCNQIVITMPQTVKTITNTVQMVTNRKIDITDDDLVELLSALWSINERSRRMRLNAETEEKTIYAWIKNDDIDGYVKTWWTENGVIGVTFLSGNTYITGANNVLIKEVEK